MQEHWSGLPFPSPMNETEKVKVKSLSCVQLLATPWTAADQAPPSMGFSRQEYWSGLPLPSPPEMLVSMIMSSKQKAGRNLPEKSHFINQSTRKRLKLLTSEFLSPNPKMPQKKKQKKKPKTSFGNAYPHIQRFYWFLFAHSDISRHLIKVSM